MNEKSRLMFRPALYQEFKKRKRRNDDVTRKGI